MTAALPGEPQPSLGEHEYRRKRTISAVFAAAGVITCAAAGAVAFLRGQHTRGWIISSVGLISLGSVFLFRRVRNLDLVNGFALSCVAVFTLYLLVIGGTDRSGAIWVVIAPPLLLFALGVRLGGLLTAAFLLAVSAVLFLPIPFLQQAGYSLDYKLRILPALLFVTAVAFVFELARMRVQSRLEAEVQERRRAEARAERASRAKSDFLARVSHELRTPLAGLLGTTHLLADRPPEPRARELLEAQRRAGEDLRALVDQLLDLARIESGHVSLELGPTDLGALCREALELVRARAVEKGLALELELEPGLPRCVRADGHRLKQVLWNLLSNAVRLTPRGRVRLTGGPVAGPSGAPGAPAWVRLAVKDTGPGVRPEDRERIFEEFVQAAPPGVPPGGAGLGLAICRELVSAMGGRMTLDSPPGAGATFGLELPLPECDPTCDEVRPAPAVGEALGLRVLLAEDEPICRLVMQGMLARLGCGVELAHDGRQAVERAAAQPFDCVLMDCEMPVLDGYQATREIRAAEAGSPGARRVPILAVTASALAVDRERCLSAGMDGVLPKPVSPAELHAALAALHPPVTGR
ncbi:MAG TPA: response regulator [Myxococcota bacterium]|nr:response regulator [Myxococcota bacterium]HRY93036.1 response regulator [Myxococcota bacterium]HSA22929.1 response regulator [Myxococcota bacterium]